MKTEDFIAEALAAYAATRAKRSSLAIHTWSFHPGKGSARVQLRNGQVLVVSVKEALGV